MRDLRIALSLGTIVFKVSDDVTSLYRYGDAPMTSYTGFATGLAAIVLLTAGPTFAQNTSDKAADTQKMMNTQNMKTEAQGDPKKEHTQGMPIGQQPDQYGAAAKKQ
jgi:hypothetical protein